jgi:HEPN domain-containing protein
MPAREHVLAVAGEWAAKAENDLKNAAHTLTLGEKGPLDTVCFHAQQCVEKYLKAALVLKNIDVPKTHSVANLISLLPPASRPTLSEAEQDRLTEYATVMRYPGDYEPVALSEARCAVALARRVRREVRQILPPAARRRTGR